METIFKVIHDIKRFIQYRGGSTIITVHAQTSKVNEIINDIQKLFSYIDWTWAIKNNKFIFAQDNIELSFVNNEFIKEDEWKIVSSSIYKSTKKELVPLSEFGFIFYYDYCNVEKPEVVRKVVTNNINFCIANDIDFKIIDNWLFYSKDPYNFTFKRLGINKESINMKLFYLFV